MSPKVMTLLQWAAANGRVTTADVDAHLHAGLRSKPRWKSYDRWFADRLRELQDARDATTRDYEAACARRSDAYRDGTCTRWLRLVFFTAHHAPECSDSVRFRELPRNRTGRVDLF